MTVAQLIEKLQKLPQELAVTTLGQDGYEDAPLVVSSKLYIPHDKKDERILL